MTITNWIAIAALAVSILGLVLKSAQDNAKTSQKMSDLEKSMESIKKDMTENSARRINDSADIQARITTLEKQQAVTEAMCQNLKENMARVEANQNVQGQKIDTILEVLYSIREKKG